MLPEVFGTKKMCKLFGVRTITQFATPTLMQFCTIGDKVNIDEDDIRDYYDRSRITDVLINELSNDLHNVWINYSEGDDEDYWLGGELSDYI